MAVASSDGRARGEEPLNESVILVDLHYDAREPLPPPTDDESEPPETHPHYDKRSRQLWFDGALLKQVQRPGSNQAKILLAFDEEEWPERVYDPLPPKGEIDPRKRLQDTVYALNRSIERKAKPGARYLVKFHVEEDGTAMRWERVEAAETTAAQASPRVWRPEQAIRRTEQLPRRCK